VSFKAQSPREPTPLSRPHHIYQSTTDSNSGSSRFYRAQSADYPASGTNLTTGLLLADKLKADGRFADQAKT